ncbi:MAG: Na/Pi cotransporter family protein [Lentisphaerae bacterium]|nr:Na/Pi cotransporter family protein [Lentisphaerota bacterium]
MRYFYFLLLMLLIFVSGCGKNSADKISQVKIVGGNEQCLQPDGKMSVPLRVHITGQSPRNLFGKSSLLPVPGTKVLFKSPDSAKIKITPVTAVADAGGMAEAKLTFPETIGEQLIEIVPLGAEEHKLTTRVFSGLEISGANAEYFTGSTSDAPLVVKITRHGKGVPGIPVRFRFANTVEGVEPTAQIMTPQAVTDSKGIASTFVKMGKKTGCYNILVSAGNAADEIRFSDIKIELQAIDLWSVILCVTGGLAFFLLGMCMMSDGIRLAAGENMRKILSYFTSNRVSALLAGTVVTAIIQSSSATTVMVIGFINAGLLTLVQSMGIIFGANIGTTITAQIISFNLSGLALPCIAVGFFLTLSKKRTVNAWGTVLLGFGLLFFGMQMMSSELKLLGEMSSFRMFFSLFDCAPVNGSSLMPLGSVIGAAIIGIVMTMILQSSSAFTGIVLALAAGQLVNFYTAVPLLIGSNIGTTVTAQLGALNANRVAKQAALAHTLFNVLGAVIVVAICYIPYKGYPSFLYLVNSFTPGNAFAEVPQNLERHIAMFHTIFNIAVALLLLPLAKQFASLCTWLIPLRDEVRTTLLEPALLNTPSVALKLTSKALEEMVGGAWSMVNRAVNDHFLSADVDEKKYEQLAEEESHIDQMQSDVTAYLVQLTRKRLVEPQAQMIPLLMHCTNDAERIADHCEIILQLNDRMVKQDKKLSETARKEVKKLWKHVEELSEQVVAGLAGKDQISSVILEQRLNKIHALADEFEAEHIERLRKGSCTAACGVIFIELLGEIVKIADRLANIAERSPEIRKHYVNL